MSENENTYGNQDLAATAKVWKADPSKLTDRDIEIVRYFYGDLRALEARADQCKAQNGLALKSESLKTRPAQPVAPPVDTSSTKGPLTRREDEILTGIFKALKLAFAQRDARIAALEASVGHVSNVRSIETKPRVTHRGKWEEGRAYEKGDAVLHSGRLFSMRFGWMRNTPVPGEDGGIAWTPIGAKKDAAA